MTALAHAEARRCAVQARASIATTRSLLMLAASCADEAGEMEAAAMLRAVNAEMIEADGRLGDVVGRPRCGRR